MIDGPQGWGQFHFNSVISQSFSTKKNVHLNFSLLPDPNPDGHTAAQGLQ
jgi:hypothetical protein